MRERYRLLAPRLLTGLPKPSVTLSLAVNVPPLPAPVQVQLVVQPAATVPVCVTFQISFAASLSPTVNVYFPSSCRRWR